MLNKITINGKNVQKNTIIVEDVNMKDYPDFSDAFPSSAQFEDGTPLNEEELQQLQDQYPEVIYERINDKLF